MRRVRGKGWRPEGWASFGVWRFGVETQKGLFAGLRGRNGWDSGDQRELLENRMSCDWSQFQRTFSPGFPTQTTCEQCDILGRTKAINSSTLHKINLWLFIQRYKWHFLSLFTLKVIYFETGFPRLLKCHDLVFLGFLSETGNSCSRVTHAIRDLSLASLRLGKLEAWRRSAKVLASHCCSQGSIPVFFNSSHQERRNWMLFRKGREGSVLEPATDWKHLPLRTCN